MIKLTLFVFAASVLCVSALADEWDGCPDAVLSKQELAQLPPEWQHGHPLYCETEGCSTPGVIMRAYDRAAALCEAHPELRKPIPLPRARPFTK